MESDMADKIKKNMYNPDPLEGAKNINTMIMEDWFKFFINRLDELESRIEELEKK